jgi:hypothetical protein
MSTLTLATPATPATIGEQSVFGSIEDATDSVTEMIPTADDVVTAWIAADDSLAGIAQAVLMDSAAFTASAILTHQAIAGGVTGKAIAAAASARKIKGMSSNSMVQARAKAGAILLIPAGEKASENIPADKGPRDIQGFYSCQAKVAGKSGVNVSVTPAQHAEIVKTAANLGEAWTMLAAAVKSNEKRKAAAAASTDSGTDSEDSDSDSVTESLPVPMSVHLTNAITALTAALTADADGSEFALLAQIDQLMAQALELVAETTVAQAA